MRNKVRNAEKEILARAIVSNVRTLCHEKGLTIVSVEEYAGVAQGYLSRVYSSCFLLSLYTVYKIAEKLEVTIDDLVNIDFAKEQRIKELETELQILKGEISG